MCQYCFIVPKDVLIRLSEDKTLSEAARRTFADTATLDTALRKVRVEVAKMAQVSQALAPGVVLRWRRSLSSRSLIAIMGRLCPVCRCPTREVQPMRRPSGPMTRRKRSRSFTGTSLAATRLTGRA